VAGVDRETSSGLRAWTPGRIGRLALRNRFVLTGHGTAMVSRGRATDQLIAYYAERAKGGVALIMLGTQQVHPTSPGLGHLIEGYDDSVIPELRAIADAIHAHGGRVFGYIGHFGAQAATRPHPPWSASAIYDETRGEVSHSMTEAEMEEIAEAHATAAARNIEAGLDGIEVHGGHGLLLQQFLSPLTNWRTDAWGGSLENRLRFPIAVIRAVRGRIGPDVPLGMRLSGDETVVGGLTVEDMHVIVPRLVAAAALDYVDISAGNDRHAVSNMLHHPPMGLPRRPYAAVAKAIRATVAVPVIHGTRIADVETAEALLADGEADFVGMCRALIADPHLPNKARDGRLGEIVPCVACEQACIGHLEKGRAISCVGNPRTSRETRWSAVTAAPLRRRILVVGAGPAGLEAGATAAERGHEVLVLEREAEPGGLLRLAALAPGRAEWGALIRHKVDRLEALGVTLRCGEEATVERVLDWRPDLVIAATGTRAGRPDLPGVAAQNVLLHRGVFAGAQTEGTVLVVDMNHHQEGVSTALLLAERGCAVSVATRGARAGHQLETPNFTRAQQLLAERGIGTITDFALACIEGGQVIGHNVFTGAARRLGPYGTIVLVTPGEPDGKLTQALDGRVPIHRIGDCLALRDVEAAILDGHELGRSL
jgi:2,4-dienoyl-CoA reductase-like NADH-dependent reductase (Old Yellow Enzyme family)